MADLANPDSRKEPSRRRIFQQLPLTLPRRELPPSIPLILPSNLEYDPVTNSIKKLADKPSASPQLCLSDDAVILLQTIKKPVAVLTICGPFRSGKSYFLSRMLDASDTFKVGHKMHGCTRGIWMATTALECEEFVLLLLDTEGIDATGVNISQTTTASNILVLSTLASSFLIYNSKDVPRQSDLDKMSCFAQLSSCIQTEAESDDLPDHYKHFPDLLWLLRDVDLEITDEDDQPLTPTEYIKSQVLCRSKDPGMCSPNDEVVKAIRTLFPSLECKIIPHPTRNPAKDPSMLSPEFNEALDVVIQYVFGNVSAKKGYLKGDTVDGPTLAALLGQYVSALNTGPQLVLESTWLGAIRPRLEDLAQKALTDYKSKMTDLETFFPLEEGEATILPADQSKERTGGEEEDALEGGLPMDKGDTMGNGALSKDVSAGGSPEGKDDVSAGGSPEGKDDVSAGGAPSKDDVSAGGSPEGKDDVSAGGAPSKDDVSTGGIPEGKDDVSAGGSPEGKDDVSAGGSPEGKDDVSAGGSPEGKDDVSAGGSPEGKDDVSTGGAPSKDDVSAGGSPEGKDDVSAGGSPEGKDDVSAGGVPEGKDDVSAGGVPEGKDNVSAGGVPEGKDDVSAGGAPSRASTCGNRYNKAPQMLMGIHRRILAAELVILQREMDSTIPVSSASTEAVKSKILSDLNKQIAEYEYDQEGLLKVKGGVLYQFIAKNYQKSTEHCEEVFTQVYSPLMENFNQPFDDKVNGYMTRAVGPAKQAVFEKRKREFFNFTAQLAPGPPEKLRVVGRGHDRIKICWEPPTLHPLLMQHYSVEIRKTKETGNVWSKVKTTKKMSSLITGLGSDTKYSFRVYAVTGNSVRSIFYILIDTQTKFSPAAQKSVAALAGVGIGLTAPVSALGIGARAIYHGRKSDDKNLVTAGAAVAVTSPFSTLLYPIAAPAVGISAAVGLHKVLKCEGDLSDSEPSDFEELGSDHEELQSNSEP